MRILLVNDYATPSGGAELLALHLRDGLRHRGYDARLFASSARPGRDSSFADYECFGTTSRFRTLLQTANPWAFWELRRVLAAFKPDLVHVKLFLTQLSPLILPLLRNVPALYQVHWYRPVCPLGTKMLPDGTACSERAGAACSRNHCLPFRDWLPLMLQVRLWRHWRNSFNLVIADSEAVRRRLIADGIGRPVEVVWPGVRVQPARPPLSLPPTVAFAGRLVREKGADVLVSAFAKVVTQIPQARLLIIGDGPEREHLNIQVANLGLGSAVSVLGQLPHAEMERHFRAAWVQAVPSRWAEPFGLVAVDAMMRGTAVLASDSGGLIDIVRHGYSGLLVAPSNPDALADGLLRLLRNREIAEEMGRVGREIAVARFSEAASVDKLIGLYQRVWRS